MPLQEVAIVLASSNVRRTKTFLQFQPGNGCSVRGSPPVAMKSLSYETEVVLSTFDKLLDNRTTFSVQSTERAS